MKKIKNIVMVKNVSLQAKKILNTFIRSIEVAWKLLQPLVSRRSGSKFQHKINDQIVQNINETLESQIKIEQIERKH